MSHRRADPANGTVSVPDATGGQAFGWHEAEARPLLALIHDPDLLILDEPTSGVDSIARDRLWQPVTRSGFLLGKPLPYVGLAGLSFALMTVLKVTFFEALMQGSFPALVQQVMSVAPTTHFVSIGQAVLFRGAGFAVVWPQLPALDAIGGVLFRIALRRLRSAISQMA